MSEPLYTEIKAELSQCLGTDLAESTLNRLVLLTMGILTSQSAAPAQIAKALHRLGLSQASEESLERQVRRIENDPDIEASRCVHPLARRHLALGQPQVLYLIIDPTSQDERVVMLTVSVWYRGRSLPLVWAVWPANRPLTEARFWERVAKLLEWVKELLPVGIPVIWLADRAFGTPAFTDLVIAQGWDYVVRVQAQTHFRDGQGREYALRDFVSRPDGRTKRHGQVFKKRGWRAASVVAYWGRRHQSPLCLVSSLPPGWHLIALYRRRFPIEATFRHYKSYGWQWERGQVTDLDHLQRLLVGLALATWLALLAGTQVATEQLAKPPSGRRRTRPWMGKHSLFTLGLMRLSEWLHGNYRHPLTWQLTDWEAPNWQDQILAHHLRAFVFALTPPS